MLEYLLYYFGFFTFLLITKIYQPSKKKKRMCDLKKEPLSATYMQHKPLSNGLLLYLLACAVEHGERINGLPFILDFLPHLVVNDTAPDDTIMQFKNCWPQSTPFPD